MFVEETEDLVGFSYGSKGEIYDIAVQNNGSNYLKPRDELSLRFRKFYYAVMLHGWVDSVTPARGESGAYDAKNFASKVKQSYQKNGKNRAILLLSCFTGLGFAKQLAKELNVPVAAPRSSARVNSFGGIVSEEESEGERNPYAWGTLIRGGVFYQEPYLGYHVPNRPDWVFCHPSGNVEIIGAGKYLDKSAALKLAEKYVITI